jgi:serine/threonine protein kinase
MRGTVGFIAPEVFSRNFGVVSHKSDVYSYGMLVLEMVGGRKNFDGGFSHTSETYFPHWIYTKLKQGNNSGSFGEIIEDQAEDETTKKMIIVSLWCIQTNPSDRPSIGKAIEMLEGTLQSLPFPPKPFLDSPTRSPQDSSMTS